MVKIRNHKTRKDVFILILLGILMIFGAIYFSTIDVVSVRDFLLSFGVWAPLVGIMGMIIAVVIAPIPSLPFDLAAGALFGWFWGGVVSMIGALIGAIFAFLISRKFGKNVVRKYAVEYSDMCESCSENYIFILLLISRLIPFISYPIISYAAGLTRIRLSRFILATTIGIIPITFLITYSGSLLTYSNIYINIAMTVIILFTIFIIPKYMANDKVKNYVKKKVENNR